MVRVLSTTQDVRRSPLPGTTSVVPLCPHDGLLSCFRSYVDQFTVFTLGGLLHFMGNTGTHPGGDTYCYGHKYRQGPLLTPSAPQTGSGSPHLSQGLEDFPTAATKSSAHTGGVFLRTRLINGQKEAQFPSSPKPSPCAPAMDGRPVRA